MKKIKLTQGKIALVDDEDYDRINKFKWHVSQCGKYYYAKAHSHMEKGKSIRILMHRLIIDAQKGQDVDHIDGNTLNNKKGNLRICNRSQNAMNRKIHKNNKSGYKGISWSDRDSKWYSRIMYGGKYILIGLFDSKIAAAKAYDKSAIKYHEEFANLNFKVNK